ncbi:DUF2314 domain-containing protein [Schlesneria sp.]|uniref:DUF2314 domain-containing protein n=1 Tax=Schlesneria sp. TaxID=2762018 RepID=UPI002EF2C7B3
MRYVTTAMFLSMSLSVVFTTGCDTRNQLPDVPHRVTRIEDSDEEMNAAMQKAKETFHQFEKNWQRLDIEGYSIKLGLKTDHDGLEHIWFTPIKIDPNQITATCANDPVEIARLKFGDTVKVDRSAVSDWMIHENGKCYGGYTIRVLAEREPDHAPPLIYADYPE